MVENKYPHKYPVLFGYLCEKLMSRAVKPLLASQIEAVKPKEKDLKYRLQVNFTQATKICLNFFRYKGKEPPYDIEATIQRFLLPIRPNRKGQRVSVSTCVVSFNYRLA